ncbi:EAL domain-containing protein [Exiguobacterium flavidum]|uniref:EAL domain-containing protein n=1 Tax=Exiguobacterium flavidum TaxID=2184695 RepID=UPI000DF82ECE|nr:EAL domain-containing protein [Exiguobacterium flavidum]
MWHPCADCGIAPPMLEKGFLLTKEGETFSYDSLYTLEGILERLSEREGCEVACVASTDRRYVQFTGVRSFHERLKNRDVVEFIQRGEMISFLQPILTLEDVTPFGYEALLRAGEGAKTFSPGELFSVASKTGFHSRLDQRAREEAIRATHLYVPEGQKTFINFLPSTIYNPDFCLKHTFETIERYGVDPNNLVFEVVETERIEDVDHLKRVLAQYKQEGIKVALDDVGAGFSTLEMLQMLQPDFVKIDRSYIDRCDESEEKERFLRQAHSLTTSMGIKSLAEGIERQEEYELCREIGFDYGQGYLFGKPRAGKELLVIN